jgi:hypothetical protein
MSAAVVDASALDRLVKKLNNFKQEVAEETLRTVQDLSPEDTGQLKKSWTVTLNDSEHEISFENDAVDDQGVPYAGYVEYGTVHMHGHFMVHRTVAQMERIVAVAKQKAGL